MRDLGQMGESTFTLWCGAVGLVANGSRIDKTGWDFFVDFPLSSDDKVPQDMLQAPIECKVQVKATDNQSKKCQITVSNLRRLIRAQMPCFYCFIEYNGTNTAQSAYLVHVGSEIIEKTLKRMRELEVSGKVDKFHKRTITIHYDDSNKLNKLTGEYLKETIESYVHDGIEKYVKQKNELLNTLGFEEGSGKLTITISEENPFEKIVDLTLGVRKELSLSKLEGYHQRFGILSNAPFVHSDKGRIFLDVKPVSKVLVTFKEYDFSPEISFDAFLYLSPQIQNIPQKYVKFRIEADFFDMVFEPFNGIAKLSFSLENTSDYPLLSLNNILKGLTLFRKSKDSLIVSIKRENLPPFSVKIKFNETIDNYSDLYQICEEAVALSREFSIAEKVMVSIESLAKYRDFIKRMYLMINESPEKLKIEFETENQAFNNSQTIACVFMINTIIGNYLIGCFIAFIGEPKILQETKGSLIPKKIQVGQKFIAHKKESIEQDVIEEGFDKFNQQLTLENVTVIRMK